MESNNILFGRDPASGLGCLALEVHTKWFNNSQLNPIWWSLTCHVEAKPEKTRHVYARKLKSYSPPDHLEASRRSMKDLQRSG